LVDREGDNALHWAAFKGNSEMCRLLIYSGFNAKQRDNFGQTPLHLGCLSGSLTTVEVLVEQDIELEAVDFNGNVPKKLAEGNFQKLSQKTGDGKFIIQNKRV
jgi:ankyrin repeat protein